MKKRIAIIGTGFSGTTIADLLSKDSGNSITLFETNSHPGGGCWTKYYGGHPYTLGPRIFYTPKSKTFEYLDSKVKIRQYVTRSLSYVEADDNFYSYPLQWKDIERMPDKEKVKSELDSLNPEEISIENFESYWLSAIGPTMYEKFVNNYSKKMWSIDSNKELSANFEWINKGTPIRNGDERLFGDQLTGYPFNIDGYNSFFKNILKDKEVHYSSKVVHIDRDKLELTFEKNGQKEKFSADLIINTGHTDEVFNFEHGELAYSGRQLIKVVLPSEYAFEKDYEWVHYSGEEEYTRIVDFKKVTQHKSPNCLLTIEIPADVNRLYPKQIDSELTKYKNYQNDFPNNYFCLGRLGNFKYTGICDAIDQAHNLYEDLK